ncbi:MAG: hypothetical protein EA377_01880 [Phycisphaerales bacterium]|nr:MAG: hypothetical protein EA377_01880 [Phycisphaerales bacterium]
MFNWSKRTSSGFGCRAAVLSAAVGFGALTGFATASDFEVSILIQDGDTLPGGLGTVSNVNDISVNDNGDWIVDVSLTGGSTNRALILNGDVWLAHGDPIAPDDSVSSVANQLKALNSQGDVTFRPTLDQNGSGVYLNFTPLVLLNDITDSDKFAPDSNYAGFFRSRVTDDGDVLALVTISDSVLGSRRTFVWLTLDERTGEVTEDVFLTRFDGAPGTETGVEINNINSGPSTFNINAGGDVLFSTTLLDTPTDTNGALYYNDTLVARKGDESPIAGSEYSNIGSTATRVDLNNTGDYIWLSQLTNQPTGTNQGIFRNNIFTDGPDEVVIQRGDPAPGIPGANVDLFGTGVQPQVTDNGDVLFYARLDGDADFNQVLYRNDQVILRKGETTVDGNLITTVCGTTASSNGITQTLDASNNGDFAIVRVRFENGNRAALLIDFTDVTECPLGDLNCDGVVNVFDLLILLENWGTCPPAGECIGDLNDDGVVNVFDLLILLENWG